MAFLSSAGCTLPGQIGRNHGCGHLCARVRPSRPSPARVTACAAASTPMPEDTLEAMSGGAGFIEHDDGVVDILGGDYDIIEEKTKKVRQRTSELLDAINKERESNLASDADSLPPLEQDETIGWVRTAVRAGDERKALNPVAIRVMRVTYITSWMVALTGKSAPQLRAIANLVEENMFKEHDATPKRSSGSPQSGWILLDYGDMIVNIFTPEQRANYNLEGLWHEGEVADISDCLSEPSPEGEKSSSADDSLDDWV